MLSFHVITIFPSIIHAYIGESILKRAIAAGLVTVEAHDLRDYALGRHKTVDDAPYGGGAGMVMKPEPFFSLIEDKWPERKDRRVILLSPMGRTFSQDAAEELSRETREIVLLSGRYEAIDERVREALVDDEISIGDYVLTGGELAALVIIDSVARMLPGALGDSRSSGEDSFSCGLLDYPHYTRPESFRGMAVPGVLLSGHHADIQRWRRKQALRMTLLKRPDLLKHFPLTPEDTRILEELKEEES